MRASSIFLKLLGICAAAAIVIGCSGAQTTVPLGGAADASLSTSQLSASRHKIPSVRIPFLRFAQPIAQTQKQFVDIAGISAPHGNETIISDVANFTVTVWSANGQLNALLFGGQDGPAGLATDSSETLYVTNALQSNVLVYPKPYSSYTLVLADFGGQPNDVAVSQAGIVAVTNVFDPDNNGPGFVNLYAKGSASPCATIADPGWREMAWDAFDKSGNLYISGINSDYTKVLIGEISGGCKATSIKSVTVGNVLQSAGDIQVYDGKVLVLDPSGLTIYTYAPRTARAFGVPVARLVLPKLEVPTAFALMAGKPVAFWIIDEYEKLANRYSYPSGSYLSKLANNLIAPYGIAVNPARKP